MPSGQGGTQDDFVADLLDVRGAEEGDHRRLWRTDFDSVDAQLRDALIGRLLAGRADDFPITVVLADLLRALADVLDAGQARWPDCD